MKDPSRTKQELIEEISIVKKKIKKLEKAEAKRKRAEETLQESNENFRRSLDESPLGVRIVTAEGETIYANRAILDFHGYDSDEELKTTPVEKRYTPESYADFKIRRGKRKRGVDVPSEYTIDIIRKNGEVLHLQVYRKEILWNGERQYQVVYQDVTDRKRAAEALQSKTALLEAQTNATIDGILVVDENQKRVLINQRVIELFNVPQHILHNDDDTAMLSYVVGQTKYPEQFLEKVMYLYDHPDETSRDEVEFKSGMVLDRYSSPVRGKDGKSYGRIWTFRDVTDRKRAEDEKRMLEERLQRAEKMEALGTMAGGIAHDLNNVLGIVVGFSELLLMDAVESSPIRTRLVHIMKGGERAAAIVQDMLTLARRGVPSSQVLNLNKIIADCQQSPEFEKLSSYHPSVKIKTDCDPDLLNISGSSVHLDKTLFNLVSNASEAMSKEGVLTIKMANQYLDKHIQGYDEVREGDYVVLSVSDTGEGIHAADLKRIFEPFYTKKVMGRSGTGLGLAVVWGTVKDHNGYIDVQSKEGKGTTFTLYFPVTREAISAERIAVAISEYMGKGESILVVDDVKGQRDLAVAMLKKLNYNVASVSSGEDAAEYVREHIVDLLVLDMIMDPGMDGLDTYRIVLEIRPKQKAIIVSGFSESYRVNAAQTLGAGAYVRKPYVIEKLGMAVKNELARK